MGSCAACRRPGFTGSPIRIGGLCVLPRETTPEAMALRGRTAERFIAFLSAPGVEATVLCRQRGAMALPAQKWPFLRKDTDAGAEANQRRNTRMTGPHHV